jgi:hypothetical protein
MYRGRTLNFSHQIVSPVTRPLLGVVPWLPTSNDCRRLIYDARAEYDDDDNDEGV